MSVFGQINFKQGYYVNTTGEKVEGLISNSDWSDHPSVFYFKSSPESLNVELGINDAIEYGIEGQSKFQKHIVDIDRSLSSRVGMSNKRNPIFEKDTLFLSVVIEGSISLLKYESNQYFRYFYKETGKAPIQLIYKKYYKSSDQIGQNKEFQQQIKNLSVNGSMSDSEMGRIQYNERSLFRIFKELNEKNQTDYITFGEDKVNQKIQFYAVGGTRYLNNEIKEFANYYSGSVPYEFTFLMGLESELILPFKNNRWSLYFGSYFHRYSGEKEIEYSSRIIPKSVGTMNISYNTIELNFGVRNRVFINSRPVFYIFPAISLNFPINGTISFPEDNTYKINTCFNYNIGMGYNPTSKITIELSFSTLKDFLHKTEYQTEQQGIGLLVKYNLNRQKSSE
ncbi:hypothetical protein [Portibacter lacus]|uniref:hypothetical protein n=1 Tax=Portibacter lacus TaxID=1099794 RepID=UPI001F23350A|nr:hypothetical protein [Portibacter lacus]